MPRDVDDRTLPADPTANMHAVTKQYCDANRASYIEWAASPVTATIDKYYVTTAGSAVSARIYIAQPLKVTRFSHDFNGTGTFDCLLSNGPVIPTRDNRGAVVIAEDEHVSSTGLHHFEPATPMVLMPGYYFVTIRYSDGSSTMQWNCDRPGAGYVPEDDGATSIGNTLFRSDQLYLDGTLQAGPVAILHLQLTAYPGTWRV